MVLIALHRLLFVLVATLCTLSEARSGWSDLLDMFPAKRTETSARHNGLPAEPAATVLQIGPGGFNGRGALAAGQSFRTNSSAYDDLIRRAAREHQVDFALVKAIMHVESAFNPYARSHKGAHGLMQVLPSTARRYGVDARDIYDPYHNVQAGVRYLKFLTTQFRDIRHVIAAYNAGENAVLTHRGIPPYDETVNYVVKVMQQKRRYSAQ